MSKVRTIEAKDVRWVVYNEDDPDQVFGENLTGPESDRLMKRLRDRCINTAANMTY